MNLAKHSTTGALFYLYFLPHKASFRGEVPMFRIAKSIQRNCLIPGFGLLVMLACSQAGITLRCMQMSNNSSARPANRPAPGRDLNEILRFSLHCQIGHGCTRLAKHLIQCGTDVNRANKNGHAPLHFAARYGRLDAVELLLANDARIDQPDHLKRTPLFWAARYGHPSVVNLLLARGADVDHADAWGKTPLHYTSNANHLKVAGLLLAEGASIDPQDRHGFTPLHLATHHTPRRKMIRLLLANNADINAQDKEGGTSLAHALLHGASASTVKLLITRGARMNMEYCIKKNLLRRAEYTLEITQKFIWHLVMGNPPHDSEQSKYLCFLAQIAGIEPSFRPSLSYFYETPHDGLILRSRIRKKFPLMRLKHGARTTLSATFSPQDILFVLSRQSHAHIKQVFGHTVLNEIRKEHLYKNIARILKK